ncbi:MAG TPA: hypothetical protein VKA15_06220 [Isosphaeraceae bacterium]|nr:hypothetical protein [Isosphaeraceae bacterium]
MLITRFLSLFPSRRTLVTVTFSSVLGGVVAISVSGWLQTPDDTSGSPRPSHDLRYVSLGRAYLPQLGQAYAAAWDQGAKALDSGQGISAALDTVAQTWTANRTEIYDKLLTPELVKIVPESVKDSDVTPAERAALAAAWRGFALGLKK